MVEPTREEMIEVEEEVGTPSRCPFKGDIANDCADCAYGGEYHYDQKMDRCIMRDVEQPKCLADHVIDEISERRREYEKHFKASGDPVMKKGKCMECGVVLRADTEEELLNMISIHNELAHKTELGMSGVKTSFVDKPFVPKKRATSKKREHARKDEEVAEWV